MGDKINQLNEKLQEFKFQDFNTGNIDEVIDEDIEENIQKYS